MQIHRVGLTARNYDAGAVGFSNTRIRMTMTKTGQQAQPIVYGGISGISGMLSGSQMASSNQELAKRKKKKIETPDGLS